MKQLDIEVSTRVSIHITLYTVSNKWYLPKEHKCALYECMLIYCGITGVPGPSHVYVFVGSFNFFMLSFCAVVRLWAWKVVFAGDFCTPD